MLWPDYALSTNNVTDICNPSVCNHEGECIFQRGRYRCTCFDNSRYYIGRFCSVPANPCANAGCSQGTCKPGIGQFICQACPAGTSGQLCDKPSDKFFRAFMFLSNRYVFYGHHLSYIMAFKCIGTEPMHIEIAINGIKIDTLYLNSPDLTKKTVFRYSRSLSKIAESNNIRNSKLLFDSGYYFSSCVLFYDVGVHPLTVNILETVSGNSLHTSTFNINVLKNSSSPCLFKVRVPYGKEPHNPISTTLDSYVDLRPIVYEPCSPSSNFYFDLSVYERETKSKYSLTLI